MKHFLSIVLSLFMMFMLIAPQTLAVDIADEWDGSIKEPSELTVIDNVYYYKISTAEELAYIAQTGGRWLGYNYILTNDIVLNSEELTYDENGNLTVDVSNLKQWTPINAFDGIFDGSDHTVSGVYVNSTSTAGFFASCLGDVLNLNIANSYVKGGDNTGGICGTFDKTGKDMKNCYFDGAVIGIGNVGGLIGYNDCTNIIDCGNYGDVWGSADFVSGVVGRFYAYGIENCFNEGNVYSTGDYVAGIAGSTGTYSIKNCINKGNITGKDYVAGICGSTSNANLTYCANIGNVNGNKYVGGISGCSLYGTVESWKSYVFESYNTGIITGDSYVGGITGYTNYADVNKCLSVGNIIGKSNFGAVVGYSESIWGKGKVSDCYYLKTDDINSKINGFGGVQDLEGVTLAKDESFFCINDDRTLNIEGHTYKSSTDDTISCVTYTCEKCKHSYMEESEHTKMGDINGDETINSTDALFVLSYTVGKTELSEDQFKFADVNKDTTVNSIDALAILQYTVGRIDKF